MRTRGDRHSLISPIASIMMLISATDVNGKPAGVLVGLGSDDDCFDYLLEHDPRLLRRIEQARRSLREGRGSRLEDVK
jgi:hypothetical protein